MKFRYIKQEDVIVLGDHSPRCVHRYLLEAPGEFTIEASGAGVFIHGCTPFYQPVDEERKIPEDFREFFVRLADAFEMSWKEQQKEKKEQAGRAAILGAK